MQAWNREQPPPSRKAWSSAQTLFVTDKSQRVKGSKSCSSQGQVKTIVIVIKVKQTASTPRGRVGNSYKEPAMHTVCPPWEGTGLLRKPSSPKTCLGLRVDLNSTKTSPSLHCKPQESRTAAFHGVEGKSAYTPFPGSGTQERLNADSGAQTLRKALHQPKP